MRENVCGIIDCTLKEQEMRNTSYVLDPIVTWLINGNTTNDENESHNSFLYVCGEIGPTDNYTCRVCVEPHICT